MSVREWLIICTFNGFSVPKRWVGENQDPSTPGWKPPGPSLRMTCVQCISCSGFSVLGWVRWSVSPAEIVDSRGRRSEKLEQSVSTDHSGGVFAGTLEMT
jgi:hypothetical protein